MKDLTGYQMGSDHLDVTQLPIKLKLESGPDDGHASGSLMKLYIYIYIYVWIQWCEVLDGLRISSRIVV